MNRGSSSDTQIAAKRQESASIEQHREADALWRSIRFQPQDDAYLVVLALVTERDRYREALEKIAESRGYNFTVDGVTFSPSLYATRIVESK